MEAEGIVRMNFAAEDEEYGGTDPFVQDTERPDSRVQRVLFAMRGVCPGYRAT